MLEALLEFKTGIQNHYGKKKKHNVDDETHASRVYYSNRTPTVLRVRTWSPFKVILMVKMINRTVNKESSGQFLALQKRSHRCQIRCRSQSLSEKKSSVNSSMWVATQCNLVSSSNCSSSSSSDSSRTAWHVKMGRISCSETSPRNYNSLCVRSQNSSISFTPRRKAQITHSSRRFEGS